VIWSWLGWKHRRSLVIKKCPWHVKHKVGTGPCLPNTNKKQVGTYMPLCFHRDTLNSRVWKQLLLSLSVCH
jgi:hypothetical protein